MKLINPKSGSVRYRDAAAALLIFWVLSGVCYLAGTQVHRLVAHFLR
ncbi:hypothetical protein [Nostoc sp. CALU 546]